jgi:hypothetical protein
MHLDDRKHLFLDEPYKILLRLFWRRSKFVNDKKNFHDVPLWNYTELLQQAELVKVLPFFGDLAASQAANEEPREGHLLSRGGDAKQFPLVGAPHGPAGCDLVPFTQLLLKRHLQVRESREKHRDELFDALGTAHFLARSVPNILRGDELVDEGQISLVEALLPTATHESLLLV